MRTVVRQTLRTQARRYVSALLAVVIAVGFVMVTNALTSAAKSALSDGVESAYPSADTVAWSNEGMSITTAERIVELAARRGDRAVVAGCAFGPLSHDGRRISGQVQVASLLDQRVVSGRSPRAPDEALVSEDAAYRDRVAVGDTVAFGTGAQRRDLRVVGIAATQSFLGAQFYLPWSAMKSQSSALPLAVLYSGDAGTTSKDTSSEIAQLREAAGSDDAVRVTSRADFVAEQVRLVNRGVDVIGYLTLLFAAIAGFVAVLVIANTFSILFAQRTRDFALLRCVGATRRQLLRSVRVEALVLSMVAATIGVLGGSAAGLGLTALARRFVGGTYIGEASLSGVWAASAWVAGVAVTSLAAWWPTRAVLRVSPLAALRPEAAPGVTTAAGRLRLLAGATALAGGSVGLLVAVRESSAPVMLAGGMTSFVGLLLLGPVIVPACIALIGATVGRRSPSVRVASANAHRNPRRTATTTASLLVGVTLASAILTGLAGAREAVSTLMDSDNPLDAAAVSTSTLPASAREAIASSPSVDRVAEVDGVVGQVSRLGAVAILAPSAQATDVGRDPQGLSPAAGEALVSNDLVQALPADQRERLTVTVGDADVTLRVRVIGGVGEAVIVDPSTVRALGAAPRPLALWVRASDGADPTKLGQSLDQALDQGASADHDVVNGLAARSSVDNQLSVLGYTVIALLGAAMVIAVVGIGNTVGLSVLERRREHALMRALGLTRRGLRRMLAAEGTLLAVVASGIGVLTGVVFGWVGVATLVRPLVDEAPLVVPWSALIAVMVAASIAGPLSCVLPARRAARIMPAEGLVLD